MAAAPVLDVTLFTSAIDEVQLFDSPAWLQVRSLKFIGPSGRAPLIRALASSPHLSRLVELDISFNRLPRDVIERRGLETPCVEGGPPSRRRRRPAFNMRPRDPSKIRRPLGG